MPSCLFLLPGKLRQLLNNAKFDLFGIQNARFYSKPVLWLQIMITEVVLGPVCHVKLFYTYQKFMDFDAKVQKR